MLLKRCAPSSQKMLTNIHITNMSDRLHNPYTLYGLDEEEIAELRPNKFYKNSKFTTQRLKITAIWRICKICRGITCKWRQELFIDQSIKTYKEVWIFWMNNMAFVSPHIPESWFRNLLNFCLLNPESWALEYGIQLKESGISRRYLESGN